MAETRDGLEIWDIDAELTQQGPKSWEVAVESRSDLIDNILPDILGSQVFTNQNDSQN